MSEKQPQFNQLEKQHSQRFITGHEVPATVLVERSSGIIDTAHVYTGTHKEDGKTTVYMEPSEEHEFGYAAEKTVNTESLSDDHQQQLARELAGVALRGEVSQEDTRPSAEEVRKSIAEGHAKIIQQ